RQTGPHHRALDDVDRSADEVAWESLREIAAHVNTQKEGVPVILFNSLSWPRTEVVELVAQLPTAAKQIQVVDRSEERRVGKEWGCLRLGPDGSRPRNRRRRVRSPGLPTRSPGSPCARSRRM